MSTVTREQIMSALFTLVGNAVFTTAINAKTGFVTKSRRLKLWGDDPVDLRPSLYMVEHAEDYVHDASDVQIPSRSIDVSLFIYINGKDPNTVPSSQLNIIMDALDTALVVNPVDGTQTLGGLVTHCYISGKVMKDPGDLDGDGLLIVPISVLIP